jgi:hypothetical protein
MSPFLGFNYISMFEWIEKKIKYIEDRNIQAQAKDAEDGQWRRIQLKEV